MPMMTDAELKQKGIHILAQHLGDVEAERFIALILRERFDYTLWRQNQPESADSIEEMSRLAMLQRAAG